jgi:hypothetical protein
VLDVKSGLGRAGLVFLAKVNPERGLGLRDPVRGGEEISGWCFAERGSPRSPERISKSKDRPREVQRSPI